MAMTDTDRIEKNVLLPAPRARVWRALTDTKEFGRWFGVDLEGTFAAGSRLRGPVTHPGYEHLTMEIAVEKLEPERLLSWRWRPGGIGPQKDASKEPNTLVTFTLDEAQGGTLLRIVESGFDGLPEERRAEAYRENEVGWTQQMKAIDRHLATSASAGRQEQ